MHGLDSWPQYFGKKLPTRYVVGISYRRSDTNELVQDQQVLDAAGFEHLVFFRRKNMHDLVESFEKLHGMLDGHARELKQERLRELAASELSPPEATLDQHLNAIHLLWMLYQKGTETESVFVDATDYSRAARRHTLGALRCIASSPDRLPLFEPLLDLHLALSHYHFGFTIDTREEEAQVAEALKKLQEARGAS
jgi:hypothetical protein